MVCVWLLNDFFRFDCEDAKKTNENYLFEMKRRMDEAQAIGPL